MDLHYADGIAAARTTLALEANPAALQRRLPGGWELAPYQGEDLRGRALHGANLLVPFHEVYATRTKDGQPAAGLAQLSYVAFVSQARHQATGELGHVHWWTYTEDPAAVPGKYRDARLAEVTRSQHFTKQRRGQTQVRETFSAVADDGQLQLSLAYRQGGMVVWVTAEEPNLPLYAAADPHVVRWYQEDQVMDVVRGDPWAWTASRRSACRRRASWPTCSTGPSGWWPCSSNGPICGTSMNHKVRRRRRTRRPRARQAVARHASALGSPPTERTR